MAILAPVLVWATPPASLQCPAPAADRGEISSGPPLVHTFRLQHTGAQGTVTITGVETGCGCIRRDLTREVLRPGETADLTLTINTLTQPAGANTWRAAVKYRLELPGGTATEHELELAVRASLVRDISVSPPELAFSTAGAAKQTVVVADRRRSRLTVIRAVCTSGALTATVQPSRDSDSERTQAVEIALTDAAPVGEWNETVTLMTDDSACPELRIPVRVSKRKPEVVTASPASLHFRIPPGRSTLSGMVQFRTGGRPVAIREATSDHPAVTAVHSAAGPVATVRVTLATDKLTAGTGRAEVRVALDEPAGAAAVIIPVTWERP